MKAQRIKEEENELEIVREDTAGPPGYTFQGEQVDFSEAAWTAAQAVGLFIERLDAQEWELWTGESPKPYAGLDADMKLVAYLSWASKHKRSEIYKSYRKPDEVRRRADQWCEQMGVRKNNEAYHELAALWGEILADLIGVNAVPEEGGEGVPGESLSLGSAPLT